VGEGKVHDLETWGMQRGGGGGGGGVVGGMVRICPPVGFLESRFYYEEVDLEEGCFALKFVRNNLLRGT